jgi:Glyoxalase superfamily protein
MCGSETTDPHPIRKSPLIFVLQFGQALHCPQLAPSWNGKNEIEQSAAPVADTSIHVDFHVSCWQLAGTTPKGCWHWKDDMQKRIEQSSLKKSIPSVNAAKLQANRLMSRLEALGSPIKRTQALEAVAAINNFPDWNTCLASLATQIPDEKEHTVLMMGPGMGKTAVVTMLFADQIRTGHGMPMLIDCTGGFIHNEIPDGIKEGAHVIRLPLSDDQPLDAPAPPKGATSVVVLIGETSTWGVGDEVAQTLTGAICRFVQHMRAHWKQSAIESIGSVFIDEFARMKFTDELGMTLRSLCDLAEVVVSSQWCHHKIARFMEPCRVMMADEQDASQDLVAWECETKKICVGKKKFYNFSNRSCLIEDLVAAEIRALKARSLEHMAEPYRSVLLSIISHSKSEYAKRRVQEIEDAEKRLKMA